MNVPTLFLTGKLLPWPESAAHVALDLPAWGNYHAYKNRFYPKGVEVADLVPTGIFSPADLVRDAIH